MIEARIHYEKEQRDLRLPWSDIQKDIRNLKADKNNIVSLYKKLARDETTYEFLRINPETGENEIVITSILEFAKKLEGEYNLSAKNLMEIVQQRMFPLISEFPYLSAWVLKDLIRFQVLDQYKDSLEEKSIAANKKIDQHERKVRGLR